MFCCHKAQTHTPFSYEIYDLLLSHVYFLYFTENGDINFSPQGTGLEPCIEAPKTCPGWASFSHSGPTVLGVFFLLSVYV